MAARKNNTDWLLDLVARQEAGGPAEWHGQKAFRDWRKTQDPLQLDRDMTMLRRAFNKAASYSPSFKATLDWARRNNVKFFIDRQCVDIGGYYKSGAGVVAIAEGSTNKGLHKLAAVAAHEIAHAWQDSRKLSPIRDRFDDYYRGTAMIEAHATAVQELVEHEVEQKKGAGDDAPLIMWAAFKDWFDMYAARYGQIILSRTAEHFGLSQIPAIKRNYAFTALSSPVGTMDTCDKYVFRKFDADLAGKPFFGEDADAVLDKILDRDFCHYFYDAARREKKEMPEGMADVLAAEARNDRMRAKWERSGYGFR